MAKREAGSKSKKPKAKGLPLKGGKSARSRKPAAAAASGNVVQLNNFRPPSQADEESFAVYAEKVRKQDKRIQDAADALRGEKGSLNGIYTAMKESGISINRIKVLKMTIKEEKRTPRDRLAEAREMAWQAKVINSPAVQLGLFDGLIKEPTLDEWAAMGEQAGLAGEGADEAPGKEGSPEYQAYLSGWKKGQKVHADKLLSDMGEQPGAAADQPVH